MGKIKPGKKLLVKSLRVFLADQAETQRVLRRDAFLLHHREQPGTALRRVAEHEFARDILVDSSIFQIFQGLLTLGMAEIEFYGSWPPPVR